jgi:hypothetical protein
MLIHPLHLTGTADSRLEVFGVWEGFVKNERFYSRSGMDHISCRSKSPANRKII